ncbi:Transcriptional regulator of ribosomal biogenesis proteins [Emydomyces testavorans]|uniref:Transcriptional regulator of ribosomal biogenesis proteins n=1 Tax=Emydomyces testavorans TaxID=2070801 RepID=A0AAF0DAR4_9EURO|nr:Transcriptional regulator of ribosomal biogenesis proteins [Emydomyces testavorans]
MRESSDTPPPLHFSPPSSDHERASTRESTPIGTPIGFGLASTRRPERDRNFYFPWQRKLGEESKSSTRKSSTDFAAADLDDGTFPLFPSSPPERTMENSSSPINISSSRQTSISPSGYQASNLTSALQRAATMDRPDLIPAWNGASPTAIKTNGARKDSFSATMAQYSNGTKPITVAGSNREKPRRESLAGSLVGGMSWGGVSVGSWIRDDIIMTGTSPFTLQSPSYHSSSYLPKLEANFMRDFSCCGNTLPTLHDLLQHYEEAHAQKPPPTPQRAQSGQSISDNRSGGVGNHMQQNQQSGVGKGFGSPHPVASQRPPNQIPNASQQRIQPQNSFSASRVMDLPDLDTVDDMEMDDPLSDASYQQSQHQGFLQTRYGQENSRNRTSPLNLGMLQNQGFRGSPSGMPSSPGRPLQNNPTVSSVNTPTFLPHSLQQQQQNSQYRNTPESSAPGTPAELDESIVGGIGDMSMQSNALTGTPNQLSGYGGQNEMLDLCIDEPAKRLFRQGGGLKNTQPNAQFRLGGAQYGPNSEIAQRIREQQRLAGVPDPTILRPDDEPKPYRCPVIGCEKAYKNQNGLKYHKSHGHNNQQLHDNADGTFSIVNPETSTPYPGTLGMEKEKPYRCEVCGKRYKNLNGLKYHKAHSPPCNPELSFMTNRTLGAGGVMQGENVNIAGAGLPGIGE